MSFSKLLGATDLRRLRAVVKKVHGEMMTADAAMITDKHCDDFIDAMCPQVAEQMIRHHFDSGAID